MLSNNKINLILIKNSKNKNYTKHIDIMYYYIQNLEKKKLSNN